VKRNCEVQGYWARHIQATLPPWLSDIERGTLLRERCAGVPEGGHDRLADACVAYASFADCESSLRYLSQ